jgi:hypothetical protein
VAIAVASTFAHSTSTCATRKNRNSMTSVVTVETTETVP